MGIQAFTPEGNTVIFTAATTAPTAAQATSSTGSANQYRIVTAPGNVTVFLGVGSTANLANANAVLLAGNVVTSASLPLLPGTDEILSFPPNSYFTGITSANTAVVYITPGDGS